VPRFDLKVALEWGHRLLAGLVSLGLAGLTWVVVRSPDLRPAATGKLVVVWVLLAIQVLLGALTVWWKLHPWTVTGHLLVGNAFCALLLWIARDLAELGSDSPIPGEAPIPVATSAAVAGVAFLLVIQLGLGGMVAGYGAGLACADWPTCNGSSIAPTLYGLVGLHVVHRLVGYSLVLAFAALAWISRTAPPAAPLAQSGFRLVILQVAIGVGNVWFQVPAELTALHSATAAGLVLVTSLLVRECLRGRAVVPGSVRLEEAGQTG
jgi:cytochrome c oxidase assembly protein subunit 15